VRDLTFSFYDGGQWREYWDTTTDTNLPRGIKVQIQLIPDLNDPRAQLPAPIQLVVPVLVSSVTNATTDTSTTQ